MKPDRCKRTKQLYISLYDDPLALFLNCRVVLWPNGKPEIWIHDEKGNKGFRIVANGGPAGLGLTIERFVGAPPISITGNQWLNREPLPMLDANAVELCLYNGDDWSQRFKSWYAGKGEHPGEPLEALD